ncbi:MAG: bifunctional hydroxymethylpyrimidine kinase/phosphomethylpyrimidine kinase [Pyrinomonadaceae bacterium]|nr:bifunctional hydroxymethylpyrimidine kinase/phosphomethylpyrimidine kinase [Pyrinomonadaceae bacterium]
MDQLEPAEHQPICLTIAGLDPSGGAGIIADIKTFFAFGCFPTAAVSSITFQNTQAVYGAEAQTAAAVRGQVEPIIDDYDIDALKTGMLPTREVIEETARLIRDAGLKNLVVDPVVRSTSGFDLIDNAALKALIEQLFPLSDLITPNIPEAERISGVAIRSEQDIEDAAGIMREMGARNVLIKGGHLEEAKKGSAVDYLFLDGELHTFDARFYETKATHGTGCTLSAAIAANLAFGRELRDAVSLSKTFVNDAIRTAPGIGKGHSPINVRPI